MLLAALQLTNEKLSGPIPVWFVFAIWIPLCVASFWFFHFGRNGRLKRAVLPYAIVFGALLFLGIASFVAPAHPKVALFMAPVVALIGWLNYRSLRFCLECAKLTKSRWPTSPAKHCSHCGAELDPTLPPKDPLRE